MTSYLPNVIANWDDEDGEKDGETELRLVLGQLLDWDLRMVSTRTRVPDHAAAHTLHRNCCR